MSPRPNRKWYSLAEWEHSPLHPRRHGIPLYNRKVLAVCSQWIEYMRTHLSMLGSLCMSHCHRSVPQHTAMWHEARIKLWLHMHRSRTWWEYVPKGPRKATLGEGNVSSDVMVRNKPVSLNLRLGLDGSNGQNTTVIYKHRNAAVA